MSVEWQEKLPGHGNQVKWGTLLDELRTRPGTWARIAERPSQARAASVAGNIKRGLLGRSSPGEFEAVSRTVDGKFYVYARYVGTPKP